MQVAIVGLDIAKHVFNSTGRMHMGRSSYAESCAATRW